MKTFKDYEELRIYLEFNRVFSFDPDYDGSCPCAMGAFKVDSTEFYFHSHCWRRGLERGKQLLEWYETNPEKSHKTRQLIMKELKSYNWYNPYYWIWTPHLDLAYKTFWRVYETNMEEKQDS